MSGQQVQIPEVLPPRLSVPRQLLDAPEPFARAPPRITRRDLRGGWWNRLAAVLRYLFGVAEMKLSPGGGLRAAGYWLIKVVVVIGSVLLGAGILLLIAIPVLAMLVEAVWMAVEILIGIVVIVIILSVLMSGTKRR